MAVMTPVGSEPLPDDDRLFRILSQFADRVESVRIERTVGDLRVEETVYLRAVSVALAQQPAKHIE